MSTLNVCETRPSDAVFHRINPADRGDVIGPYPQASLADLDRACASAARAQNDWRRLTYAQRGEVLARAAATVRARANGIASVLTREEGKTLGEATAEVNGAAAILDYYAGGGLWFEQGAASTGARSGATIFTRRYPLGIVGVITPWNFPISNPALKIGAGLLAGNAIVWKPSPWTPATSLELAGCFAEAGLPENLLAVLLDESAAIGEAMTRDERITAISFTGSTATGRRIAATAGARDCPLQLEMGGKNPLVVLADADLDAAATATAAGAFLSAGQKCTAVSRVIVERSVAEAFRERLLAATELLVVGDPMDSRTHVGPVVHERQLEAHLTAIAAAKAAGEVVIAGGHRLGGALEKGLYLAPTIIDRVASNSPIAQRELFGPILAIIEADDYEQALTLANGTEFGLAASIFTRDLARAFDFVERCEAGTVKVNDPPPGVETHVPTGGWKNSGSGPRELGPQALHFFSREKTISINPLKP